MPNDLDDRRAALSSCLEKLKSSDRELITNRYYLSTPLQEYANQVGRSVGGIKVTLHRIRNKLQSCIEHRIAAKGVGA